MEQSVSSSDLKLFMMDVPRILLPMKKWLTMSEKKLFAYYFYDSW